LRRSKVYSLSACNYWWLQLKPLKIAACFQNFDLAETQGLAAEISSRWFSEMPDANDSNSNFL
jgi:hypothetical protein